jgi:polysaccharide deacetylase family protein (PEP-CTERM system associated)
MSASKRSRSGSETLVTSSDRAVGMLTLELEGLGHVSPVRPGPLNALSFDLEEWYQVLYFESHIRREVWPEQESRLLAATTRLLEILDEYGTHATFFVLAWNAERLPKLIERIHGRGHEIASHGYFHRLVYTQSRVDFAEDLDRSLSVLQSITGRPVLGYRAPSFSITRESMWALSFLMDRGIEYDSSILPAHRPYCGIPGAPTEPWVLRTGDGRTLTELPPSTLRVLGRNVPFAGGGYLRLCPYQILSWGLRRLNHLGVPGVVYLHPWELDPGHPRLPVRRDHRFQHYVNLKRTERKLQRLLTNFRFVRMDELAAAVRGGAGRITVP